MFKDLNLLEYIPEFIEWSGAFNDLRELMQEVSKDNRDRYCDAIDERLINIRPVHNKLRATRVELTKYLEGMKEKNKRLREENERIVQQEKRAREQLAIQRRQLRAACITALIALCALGVNVWLLSTKKRRNNRADT